MSDWKLGRRIAVACLLLFLLGCTATSWGDEFTFIASVDRTVVSLDEELTLTVLVEGSGIRGVGNPQLPPLQDFP